MGSDTPTAAPAGHALPMPWVRLRSASPSMQVFKRMLGSVDPRARPGDLVAVYDKSDAPYGAALYNPKSLIALRMLTRGLSHFDADGFFASRLSQALEFRRDILRLDQSTNVYRLVHDLGDGLPGLVIDRYHDDIALEFYSLGMFRQADRIERLLASHFPSARFARRASDYTQKMEGFRVPEGRLPPRRVRENGVDFEVDLSGGRKTGFFCDQRENRLAAAAFCGGKRVLDVCSYTGGFGLYAQKLGSARETTCVELDPQAAHLCEKNARLNAVKIKTICVDAFPFLRQMGANRELYDVVILDPYKLISSRENYREGRQKYVDFNRLAIALVKEGGLLVTCSCSGMLSGEDFSQAVRTAAGSAGRRLQIFRKTGAGPDHPFAADHPEGEYLKVIWGRVL